MTNTSLIIYSEDQYTNDNAYEHVINYNMKCNKIGAYLLIPPFNRDNLVRQFEHCESSSKSHISSKLWHIIISISNVSNADTLLSLGNQISYLFMPNYQVFYGLDTCSDHNHLHIVINAYHYHPNGQPLSKEIFNTYIKEISNVLIRNFPSHQVKIQKKKEIYHYV